MAACGHSHSVNACALRALCNLEDETHAPIMHSHDLLHVVQLMP